MTTATAKWIHLTDTHLIAGSELFGLDPRARLQMAVDSINKNFADADLCMISGDLTHLGEIDAFKDVKKVLSGLKMPWHPLLGNHDDRDHFAEVFEDCLSPENGFLNFTLATPKGRIIALDTLQAGTAAGVLCETRLKWLDNQLKQAADSFDPVYIFMHHAPVNVGVEALDRIKLENPDAFAGVLSGYNHIRHIFFGHLHRPCHGSWRGIPFSTVYGTSHQTALKLDKDTPLYTSLEDAAYAVVLVTDEDVIVHNHAFMQEDRAFPYDRNG